MLIGSLWAVLLGTDVCAVFFTGIDDGSPVAEEDVWLAVTGKASGDCIVVVCVIYSSTRSWVWNRFLFNF